MCFRACYWKASYLHSQDMGAQNYFDHASQDGRTPWQRALTQGISATGENIAAGKSGGDATLQQLLASEGHCNNMGNPDNKMGTRLEPFNSTPMGVNSISCGSPHVCPMGRTCGEPNEIKKNTHRKTSPLLSVSRWKHYWTQMFRVGAVIEPDQTCVPASLTQDASVTCAAGKYRVGAYPGTCKGCDRATCPTGKRRSGTCSGTTNGFKCTTIPNIVCKANQYRVGANPGTCKGCDRVTCPTGQQRSGTCSGTTNGFKCTPIPASPLPDARACVNVRASRCMQI